MNLNVFTFLRNRLKAFYIAKLQRTIYLFIKVYLNFAAIVPENVGSIEISHFGTYHLKHIHGFLKDFQINRTRAII